MLHVSLRSFFDRDKIRENYAGYNDAAQAHATLHTDWNKDDLFPGHTKSGQRATAKNGADRKHRNVIALIVGCKRSLLLKQLTKVVVNAVLAI